MSTVELKDLENKITQAMKTIEERKQTPKESKIGILFKQLQSTDNPSYINLLNKYKPIYQSWFESYKDSPEYKKIKEALLKKKALEKNKEAELNLTMCGGGSYKGEDFDVTKGPSASREYKPKLKKEPKIKIPKEPKILKEKGDRDRSGYTFNGEIYGKGPLVLAIVKKYVEQNPNTTFSSLKTKFPDHLLKSYCVFQPLEKAIEISAKKRRFFLNDSQLIRLNDCVISVCNQFSSDNILPIINHTRNVIGFKIL